MLNVEDQDCFRVATKQKSLRSDIQLEKGAIDNQETLKDNVAVHSLDNAPLEDVFSFTFFQRKAVEIVAEVQRIQHNLSFCISDETKVLNSLRVDDAGIAQKRKQVKRCKLFEIYAIIQSVNGHISNWDVLCEKRQTYVAPNIQHGRFSLPLATVLMNNQHKIMSDLRVTLVHHLVHLVSHVDKLSHLGLRIIVSAGIESFSISLVQKAVVGIVAFNELLSLVEKCLKDVNVKRFLPKSISIKKMLTILAEERSSRVAKLLFHILEDQVTKMRMTSLSQSGEQFSWSLGVAMHLTTNSYHGHVQRRVTSDYGSDSCNCSVQNNVQEECPTLLDEETLNTIQTMVAQEDLNISRLASVIHLTFMDVKQNRQSSTAGCHQQLHLWWTANDRRPSFASIKNEQSVSSLIFKFYGDCLNVKIIDALKQFLECADIGCIQNMHLLSTGFLFKIGNCALKISQSAEVQLPLLKVYRSLISHLQITAAIKAWDIGMSSALASTSDPKCWSPMLTKSDHGTKAGRCLIQSLEPIVWLELAVNHNPNLSIDLVHAVAFPRLLNTLRLIGFWLQTTTHHALSSWHMVTFCLITQGDLKRIIDVLKHMVNVNPIQGSSQECVVVSEQTTVCVREILLRQMAAWEEINKAVAKIQNCSSNCMKDLCSACKANIQKELEQSMPQGKHWRQRCKRTGIPTEISLYARSLVDDILGPVVEGVSRLSTPTQISILSMVTKVFCETWINHILSKQIKFSLHGAHLLKLDFGHLLDFLNCQPMLSIETRQSVMSLEILRQFRGVLVILLQQTEAPGVLMRKRKVAPFSGINIEESEETETGHRMESLEGGDFVASDTLPDEEYVQNKDQWLALRVNAAKSVNWPPFWCFT